MTTSGGLRRVDRLGQGGDDLADRDAEVIGEAGLGAEQVAGHAESGFVDMLKQHGPGLHLLQHAGDLVRFGNRLADVQELVALLKAFEVISKRHGYLLYCGSLSRMRAGRGAGRDTNGTDYANKKSFFKRFRYSLHSRYSR